MAFDAFLRGERFSVQPYDNRTGIKALEVRMVWSVHVLIVEGIDSLHEGVTGGLSLMVFIGSDQESLRLLRFRAPQTKRGMNVVNASVFVSAEWRDDKKLVKPRAAAADVVVHKNHGDSRPCPAGGS